MRKIKPRKKARKNPSEWSVKKPLSPEELSTLSYVSARYDSANHLLNAYNEDTGEWNMNIVAKALIATKDEGAKFIVPLIGGNLKRKIEDLFAKVLENDEKLDMDTQMDLHDSGI